MRHCLIAVALAALSVSSGHLSRGFAAAPPSRAEELLSQIANEQKYAFVCFHRGDTAETRAMAQVLKDGVGRRQAQTAMCFVSVTDPAEQAVVQRFGVARAPMPLTLAVAPNGAITGVFSRKLSDANLTSALVTPTMANCMKSMQDGKLVIVCVHAAQGGASPAAISEFRNDPDFKDRLAVFSMQADDPAEAPFLGKMGINPATMQSTNTVFLAPPGVLIGKFDATSTKAQMAQALHKAGKCCDDPNCKHAHGSASQPTSGVRQAPQSRSISR